MKNSWNFKKTRGSRACEVCRQRKVRCDAEVHIPCTNCITFNCLCRFPEPKRRKAHDSLKPSSLECRAKKERLKLMKNRGTAQFQTILAPELTNEDKGQHYYIPYEPVINLSSQNVAPTFTSTDPKKARGMKVDYREVNESLYYGFPSSYSYIHGGLNPEKHYSYASAEFEERDYDAGEIATELQILDLRGAFHLPSRFISDMLIKCFFDSIYPFAPIINKESFIKHYNDPNPDMQPPIILTQTLLLLGLNVCRHESILDSKKTIDTAQSTIHKRILALLNSLCSFRYVGSPENEEYDDGFLVFNYSTVLVQVHTFLASYTSGPETLVVSPHVKMATAMQLCLALGLHTDQRNGRNKKIMKDEIVKSIKGNPEPILEKFEKAFEKQVFVWKKMWWFVYARSNSMAMCFGRPTNLPLKYCSTEKLSLEEFQRFESKGNDKYPFIGEYLINLVYINEIIGDLIEVHFLSINDSSRKQIIDFKRSSKQYNLLLGIFYDQLPSKLKFKTLDKSTHNMFSISINLLYYYAVFHVNRINLMYDTTPKYWCASFQAVYMIGQIAQCMTDVIAVMSNPVFGTTRYIIGLSIALLAYHANSRNEYIRDTASTQCAKCVKHMKIFEDNWLLLIPKYQEVYKKFKLAGDYIEISNNVQEINSTVKQALGAEIPVDGKCSYTNISFVLNEDPEQAQYMITEADLKDFNLPLARMKTLSVPPPRDEFYKSFHLRNLFTISTENYSNDSNTDSSPEKGHKQKSSSKYTAVEKTNPQYNKMASAFNTHIFNIHDLQEHVKSNYFLPDEPPAATNDSQKPLNDHNFLDNVSWFS